MTRGIQGLVAAILATMVIQGAAADAQQIDQFAEEGVIVTVRGYQPLNLDDEIVTQEKLFKNIVVELEFTIDSSKESEKEKPVVTLSPARSSRDFDPQFRRL